MTTLVLDTSILVRLVTREPQAMFERAVLYIEAALAKGDALHIDPIAVAEMLWVLGGPRLQVPRNVQAAAVRFVLALPATIPGRTQIQTALSAFEEGRSDWIDCYFAAVTRRFADGRVVSFNQDFRLLGVAWDEP